MAMQQLPSRVSALPGSHVHSATYMCCCISHLALVSHCRYVLRITTHGKAKVPLNPQRIVSSLLRAKPVARYASGNLAQSSV